MLMTGAQAIIESLKNEKVDVVFGYPGGAVLPLYDALYQAKFPHILTGHEQGAIHAADGYARASGKPGVCFATSGPGVCNMVTGIATANIDSIPLVIISGQVATSLIGCDSFQEADISGITTPITKHNYLVKNEKDLPRILKEAFFIATTGRPGPVLIDVAKNVFEHTLDYEYPEEVHLRGYSGSYIGDDEDIDKAVKLLEKAKRPVVMTGGGIILSNTSALIRDFVDRTQIPVVTTLMGKGAVSDFYPAHLGLVGMHGSYASNMAVQECDLLLAIGCRFSDRVTGDVKNFAPHAKIVHFEIDKVEINKNVRADVSVNGDLRWSLPKLAELAQKSRTYFAAQFTEWRNTVIAWKQAHPFANRHLPGRVSPQLVFEELAKRTEPNTMLVTDVGQHQMWAAQFFPIDKPRHFITSGGLGTMGFGLPAAMGAKVGVPPYPVVLISGDGSILMNCQEFSTIHKYGVPVKTIILHNNVLGMVNQWQRLFYGGRQSQSVIPDNPDMTKVAAAMGVPGTVVHTPEELPAALDAMMAADGSYVLDVYIPEDESVYPMVPGGKRLDQMVLGGEH